MPKNYNYKGIDYNPNANYQSQINQTTDNTKKNLLNLQRTAKIYDKGMEQYYNSVPQNLQYLKQPTASNQVKQLQKSKTQYSDQIVSMLGDLSNSLNTPLTKKYSPDEDTAYQAAQQSIQDDVYRQMERRGIADSGITQQQMIDLSMQALPQFQQQYYNRQNQDISNKMNALSQLQSLDSSEFQKSQALEQLQLQKGQITGDYITPDKQQLINNIDPGLNQYANNYQEEINKRSAVNPNDPTILQLKYLRNQKINDNNMTVPRSVLGQNTLGQIEAERTTQLQQSQLTGQYLTPGQQRVVNNGVTGEDKSRIDNIVKNMAGGYQEYLNTLSKNSDEYVKTQLLRNQKITSQGLNYKLSDIGNRTMQGQEFDLSQQLAQEDLFSKRKSNEFLTSQLESSLEAQELANVGQDLSNQISRLNLEYLPQNQRYQIAQIQQSLESGNLSNAYQTLINANLPQKLESELAQAFASTESSLSSTARSNLETDILAAGGGTEQKKYSNTDVNNTVLDYKQKFGTYDKIDGKWQITDENRNGIPDNQGKILTQMLKQYNSNPTENNYNMLRTAASKIGITNSAFAKKITQGKQGVVSLAQRFHGTKYVWGGNSLSKGVDCSGLTQQVYKNQGINLPRTALEQSKSVKTISQKNMKPGDLIFFDTVMNNGKSVDHVGIYAGNGKMTHASSSKGVTTVPMTTKYWQSRLTKVGRP